MSLFTDVMTFYIQSIKESTEKLLKPMTEFISKVAGYKINTQESVVFSYASNEQSKRKLYKQFHL